MMSEVSERSFNVNGYTLAAKEWHAGAPTKVIALHGWLDNAASFDRLAALLPNCHMIALDLSGHGLSDHKSLQATYNLWDDLNDILSVSVEMQWSQFNLIGHSRGAMMALLLAAALPEKVASLLMLDAFLPQPLPVTDTAKQLGRFLKQQQAISRKTLPRYSSVDEAVMARCKSSKMDESAAKQIVDRGLVEKDGYYYWRSDPRLTTASALKLTDDHCRNIAETIKQPTLVILAEQGIGSNKVLKQRLETFPEIQHRFIPGTHHFHMLAQAEDIANISNEFFGV